MLDNYFGTRSKGAHSITIKDVRHYWASRIWISAQNKKTFAENFPLSEKLGSARMGRNKFQRLQRLWIAPNVVKILNKAAQSRVSIIP
jgi:hypothetical protein